MLERFKILFYIRIRITPSDDLTAYLARMYVNSGSPWWRNTVTRDLIHVKLSYWGVYMGWGGGGG